MDSAFFIGRPRVMIAGVSSALAKSTSDKCRWVLGTGLQLFEDVLVLWDSRWCFLWDDLRAILVIETNLLIYQLSFFSCHLCVVPAKQIWLMKNAINFVLGTYLSCPWFLLQSYMFETNYYQLPFFFFQYVAFYQTSSPLY